MISNQLEQQLQILRQQLRQGQRKLADWQSGKMAVSAVPGAGKSHSLSVAAALAIARHQLNPHRQLIIVTYTRSAAAAIRTKIKEKLQELQLPQSGFMVQTLHGLALQVASRYPDLSGLDLETSTLVIPTPSHRVIRSSVEQWIKLNPVYYQALLEGQQFDGEETEKLRRQSVLRTEVLPSLAHAVVREAKSSGLLPETFREFSHYLQEPYPILAIAAGLYEQYEAVMQSRNLIDYDDMILAALKVLENPTIQDQWQQKTFAVFEDEAQDSSPLQGRLISILARDQDIENLVRVGDPNQAINSTFTPADPIYFNLFCQDCEKEQKLATMDQAGRSYTLILQAANAMLEWANSHCLSQLNSAQENPSISEKYSPFRLQEIKPVGVNDPQPNPELEGKGLEIYYPSDIYQTVDLICQRVIQLFHKNPERNAAILVRENRQGRFLTEQLSHLKKDYDITVYDVNEANHFSKIPLEILRLLQFIDRPHSPDYLKAALEILQQRNLIPTQDLNALATYPEQFLYPTPLNQELKPSVKDAQKYCCNLLRAKMELPHYQLILFLGMALKYTGGELATAQKLSERINQEIKGQSSLKMTLSTLNEIVSSENFEAVEEEADESYTRSKQLTIITMHKAKGLDWDYVFIPFLHQDTLPGQLRIPVAAEFLGPFTLAEVARAQIRSLVHYRYLHEDKNPPTISQPLKAWQEAEYLKEAEEYRLLYVAMTRAKRLLWMSSARQAPFTWNTFRNDSNHNLRDKKASQILSVLKQKFPHTVIKL